MKEFKSFDDIREEMINPLDNPNFYAMLIGDTRYKGGPSMSLDSSGAFSLCHNYELGSTTNESWLQLWKLAIHEWVENITYQGFKNIFPEATEDRF